MHVTSLYGVRLRIFFVSRIDETFLNYFIGLVRNFLRFFRKLPGTAENVLEYSILGVYIDSMNTVRMTIKLSKWKLISN